MDEPLDLAEERFNVIDRSFILLLEDFQKLALHFSESSQDEESMTNLYYLAKLIPSLLVEQGRIQDAIKLIQSGRKVSFEHKLHEKNMVIGATVSLMEASLRLHYKNDFDADAIKHLLTYARERSRFRNNTESIAESYYIEAILMSKLTQSQLKSLYQEALQKHAARTTPGENTDQPKSAWTLTLEHMEQAIYHFREIADCKHSASLGLAKSLLMYVDIHLRLNANLANDK